MHVLISTKLLKKIHSQGEEAYPEECAGLLIGTVVGENRTVEAILAIENAREESARNNRYLITAEDMMKGDKKAEQLGLDIIGVFHSHPDHPNRPSEFDREWAMPWFSYFITSVYDGEALGSRSWRLSDNREVFLEESIEEN